MVTHGATRGGRLDPLGRDAAPFKTDATQGLYGKSRRTSARDSPAVGTEVTKGAARTPAKETRGRPASITVAKAADVREAPVKKEG